METRYAPRDHGPSLPSIYIDENSQPRAFGSSSRSFSSQFSPSLSSIPMSIPHSSSHHNAPPPLPPPQYVPVNGPDAIVAEKYRPREYDQTEERPSYKDRAERDEGYHSLESPRGRDSFGSARFGMHHDQFSIRSSADAYDHSLLRKLDPRRARDRSPPRRPAMSSSARDAPRAVDRFALPTLSLPTRIKHQPLLESPGRYTETPLTAMSPRSTPFSDLDRSPRMRNRRTNSGSVPDDATVSTQGSYDMIGDDDFPMEETTRLRDFHIDSAMAYQTIGLKRRASSPPSDEPTLHSVPSSSDLLRRRDGASRGSPTPRLTVIPQGSISSVSLTGRSNSHASNLSLTASSAASMNSFIPGRRSPGGLSPGGMSPTEPSVCGSPYATPISLTTSPRSASARTPHHRQLSEHSRSMASPRKISELSKAAGSKRQGFHMCECCPKKPRRFDTQEELSVHEAEKQYGCSFCGNRFKNKNEAERHQNSLHVRRHSWSCSALSGYDRAFHESTSRPGEADTCGYCGDEFSRNGHPPGRNTTRHATEQDWDERIRHLTDIHKFRECNSSKKFYRADHFRQHLKHSHAGTSGKWTNMLENACMLEEDPPIPIR